MNNSCEQEFWKKNFEQKLRSKVLNKSYKIELGTSAVNKTCE